MVVSSRANDFFEDHIAILTFFCNLAGLVFINNIMKQKQLGDTGQSLIKSEEKFKTFFESSTDSILILDLKTGYIDCNPAALKIFSVSS